MRVVISGRGEELENIYIYIHSHASRRNVRSDLLSDQELLELGFTLLTLQDIDGAADVWTVNQYLGQLNDVAEAVQATTQSARPFGVFGKEYCFSGDTQRAEYEAPLRSDEAALPAGAIGYHAEQQRRKELGITNDVRSKSELRNLVTCATTLGEHSLGIEADRAIVRDRGTLYHVALPQLPCITNGTVTSFRSTTPEILPLLPGTRRASIHL